MSETTSSMTIFILAEGLLTVIVSRLDSSHELDLNQYQATCPLVDREWVCRPPHYSPPKINSISSEYILSFHLSSP